MPFISTADHKKFIAQFHLFFEMHEKNGNAENFEENLNLIKAEINKLDQIAQAYKETHSQLKNFADQYKTALRQAKVTIRQQQRKMITEV